MISSLHFYTPHISILLREPLRSHITSQNEHIELSKDSDEEVSKWAVLTFSVILIKYPKFEGIFIALSPNTYIHVYILKL